MRGSTSLLTLSAGGQPLPFAHLVMFADGNELDSVPNHHIRFFDMNTTWSVRAAIKVPHAMEPVENAERKFRSCMKYSREGGPFDTP